MKLLTFSGIKKLRNFSSKASNTIYALSSGYGKCGVSVIRVSGPQSRAALRAMTKLKTDLEPRRTYLKKIYHAETKVVIDRGLILWFSGT